MYYAIVTVLSFFELTDLIMILDAGFYSIFSGLIVRHCNTNISNMQVTHWADDIAFLKTFLCLTLFLKWIVLIDSVTIVQSKTLQCTALSIRLLYTSLKVD